MANLQTVFQRNEKKYRLDTRQTNELLRRLHRHLVQDEYGKYSICSLYFDTPGYRALGEGKQRDYKEKLRLRSYGVPGAEDTVFLELKKKLDGVTYKRRLPLPLCEAERYLARGTPPREDGQVFEEIDWFRTRYANEAKLVLCYDRVAFAGVEDSSLRITFDTNVRWRDQYMSLAAGDWGQQVLPRGEVIMEIKVAGAYPLWLSRALSAVGAYPTHFSKYRAACGQKLNKEARRLAG